MTTTDETLGTQLGVLIDRAEFFERQARIAEEAGRRGLDAIVAWSKGGGTYDAYGDVAYLANYYTAFPYLRDLQPHWTGRSHAALVVPARGDAVLLVDSIDFREHVIAAPEIRFANDVIGAVAQALTDRGLAAGRIGLAGWELLSVAAYRDLTARLPGLELVSADDILEQARLIKSPGELDMLRRAGAVGSAAFTAMMEGVRVGGTEAEAVAAGAEVLTRAGGAIWSALVASGPHDGALMWNELPGYDAERRLEAGEIFHVDMYGPGCGGYLFDFARSTIVGGGATDAQRELLDASVGAIDAVIDAIDDGVTAAGLAEAGEAFLRREGFAIDDGGAGDDDGVPRNDLNFPAWGHCLGLGLERPFFIAGDDTPIVPGMCLAIERHVRRPGIGTVAFEQNVLVLESGPEVISTTPARWW